MAKHEQLDPVTKPHAAPEVLSHQNNPAGLADLQQELQVYYRSLRRSDFENYAPMTRTRAAIWAAMDQYASENPACSSWELKARLHQEIAACFEPVIFLHSPFFFEMGLRPAENWGVPYNDVLPCTWLYQQRRSRPQAHPAFDNIRYFGNEHSPLAVAYENVFDADHHTLGYTKILNEGINGLLAEIAERQSRPLTPQQATFLRAVEMSCRAVVAVADRFAEKAEQMLADHPQQPGARFLRMQAEAARWVPANPPRTFYEGLAALWFLREVTATLEGIGISVVGHPDRQLIGLYRADIDAGRLTEAEARDLLARWLLPTDIKFFVQESGWPETSTTIELGGCDADGRVVYNELTRLILEIHAQLDLLNPKLQCRYSAESPREYLDLLGEHVLKGRNVFSLLNDDIIIPACVRAGKTEREARLYVNGGCQETMVEGVEHSAGAYYYFNMPRVLDLCLQPAPPVPAHIQAVEAASLAPLVIQDSASFEEFYVQFMDTLKRMIAKGAEWRRLAGAQWVDIHPCPWFSATLTGCIENGTDYTAGGAAHNTACVALVGFATLVDSLYAIAKAVYEDRWLSLEALQQALADDWREQPALRARLTRLPKFGHGNAEVDALAARIAAELGAFIRTLVNERGGHFQSSFFVYYMFVWMGKHVRATPDGRFAESLLSQGVGPSSLNPPDSLTDVFQSLSALDLRDHPANAVLDTQLPFGAAMPPDIFVALMRSFAQMGGATFQPNVVSAATLQAAQTSPERYQNLTVRICGLSARFVSLDREIQNEIIQRHAYSS